MSKYIDADRLKEKIYAEDTVSLAHGSLPEFDQGCHYAFLTVLSFLDSLQQEQDILVINKKDWEAQEKFRKNKDFGKPLQQEQPDFPTTDEQIKEFLATHPKIKVPEKYKNPDWLFKKQEQPEVDLEKEIDACWRNWLSPSNQKEVEGVLPKTEFAMYARHFYELGIKARKV